MSKPEWELKAEKMWADDQKKKDPKGWNAHNDDRNLLCKWYPMVVECKIPAPKTILVPFTNQLGRRSLENHPEPIGNLRAVPAKLRVRDSQQMELVWKGAFDEVARACDALGYPAFIRTDEASGKHEWADACYLPRREDLSAHLAHIIEYNEMADIMGLKYCHMVVREYIEPHHTFTAFRGMPVSLEFRLFARDGKFECAHPYWFEGAIMQGHHEPPLPKDWKVRLRNMYLHRDASIRFLQRYAMMVTEKLGGYWSVDFMLARNKWWLTDMALGDASYHLRPCKHAKGPSFEEENEDD